MSDAAPSLASLREELRALQATIDVAQGAPRELALLHRDAVYTALDVGEPAVAMTHALACLDLARAAGEASLQAKAHVALALVQAETYDDLGAATHFERADALAREAGDHRGVALAAVNATHYDMERGRYGSAVTRLQDLLDSPHAGGVELGDSPELLHTFHINYVVSAAEALTANAVPPARRGAIERQLDASAGLLRALNVNRAALTQPLKALDVLDARAREALADAYARTGRYREAFEAQREVTRRVESLYREYYQQRALVSQVEQQAREAEVRAAAFAEAALRDPLTGAPNRAHAMQLLTCLHGRAREGHSSAGSGC